MLGRSKPNAAISAVLHKAAAAALGERGKRMRKRQLSERTPSTKCSAEAKLSTEMQLLKSMPSRLSMLSFVVDKTALLTLNALHDGLLQLPVSHVPTPYIVVMVMNKFSLTR